MLPYNVRIRKDFVKKFFKLFSIAAISIIIVTLLFYLFALPKIISSTKFSNFLQNYFSKNSNAQLTISKPVLETSIKPEISFKVETLLIKKDDETLLNLKNFDTKVSFYKILQRQITLDKLGADEIYIDVNNLQEIKFKNQKKKKEKKGKSFFKITCFNTLFYVKRLAVLYETPNKVKARLLAKDLEISKGREPKILHFKMFLDLFHNNEHLKLFIKDSDNVYFKDRKLHADNLKFKVEKSEVSINLLLDEKNHFTLSFDSDKFEIDNVRRFLDTDLLIPNSHEFVSCFKDFTGDFKFKVTITEKDLNGFLKVNEIGAKLIPLADIPLTLTKGIITLDSKNIELKDFKGYYGSNSKNRLGMNAFIKNYSKTADTEINIDGTAYDEFAKYISKIAGVKINVLNQALTSFKVTFNANSKLDIMGKIIVPKGSDVLFEGASISPTKYEREINLDMDLFKDTLTMNNIDYLITDINNRQNKPLVTIDGKVNVMTGVLNELGFNIPEPLPAEFFNVLAGQRLFRNGTFEGQMKYINSKTPHLMGKVCFKDTFVVGQGLIIKNLNMITKNDIINIDADGILRRARYKFTANIQNRMLFPVIVNNINLNFDEIDVEKVIQTFAPRPQNPQNLQNIKRPQIELAKSNISKEYFVIEEKQNTTQPEEVTVVFQPNLVEIKNCVLDIGKGVYKKIDFGNLHANLTLTRKGILEIKSNQFDFAQGISNLKVFCDLAKEKYSIRLETKDVDTDAIATSMLNLPKEITGRAKALIELNTDSSLKMNGKMQFEINDGSIAKLGLVQYVLNMASVFRNPLAMISPSSVFDLVNVPDGYFSKINGTLMIKDNSIKALMIKSSSPQLSAFIVGRIDLETMDASLRIYTKFNNKNEGILGFLRGFSLNALARKARTYTKGENVSYYATELDMLPPLETGEETAQVFVTKFDGDIQTANFISSLKKIK